MTGATRAKRLDSTDRPSVQVFIDGAAVQAQAGDTVLTAILLHGGQTGSDPFTQVRQAGFCLMGACQSCWIRLADNRRARACELEVEDGLTVFTSNKDASW